MAEADDKADDKTEFTCTTGSTTPSTASLPRCVCGWKNCRKYSKVFRGKQHELLNGVIRVKFSQRNKPSLVLKEAWDRALQVDELKRNNWNDEIIKYTVARHHFTEALIKAYVETKSDWDWREILTPQKARELLFELKKADSVQISEDETGFLKVPNVPKEHVRGITHNLKDDSSRSSFVSLGSSASELDLMFPSVSSPTAVKKVNNYLPTYLTPATKKRINTIRVSWQESDASESSSHENEGAALSAELEMLYRKITKLKNLYNKKFTELKDQNQKLNEEKKAEMAMGIGQMKLLTEVVRSEKTSEINRVDELNQQLAEIQARAEYFEGEAKRLETELETAREEHISVKTFHQQSIENLKEEISYETGPTIMEMQQAVDILKQEKIVLEKENETLLQQNRIQRIAIKTLESSIDFDSPEGEPQTPNSASLQAELLDQVVRRRQQEKWWTSLLHR